MSHSLQIDKRMKLNLGPIKGESDASCDDRRQVATVFDLRNIKVNSFWQNIQQRQIQNILGPTVNYVWHQPTHFFDHASKIFVLKQGVPNGLI